VTRESPAARQRCQCLALDGPSAQGEDSPLSREMVTKLERRNVLRAAGALAVLSVPFTLALRRSQRAEPIATTPHSRSGRLVPDARGLCDLPEGFSYAVVDRAPGPLSDGYRVPACPDGMGCFSGPNGTLVLMRNHELERSPALGPFRGAAPPEAYDPEAAGCVTRVVLNSTTLERISSNLVLAGTIRNCGGGTPTATGTYFSAGRTLLRCLPRRKSPAMADSITRPSASTRRPRWHISPKTEPMVAFIASCLPTLLVPSTAA
jgi:secreted PhoX family phosphatase